MSQACTTCLKTGPVLMPFRYAVVPDRVSQPLPAWAEPQSPFPSLHGYHYALRAMRQGFIYVFYDTGVAEENAAADWEAWSVAENGDLYFQGPTGLGATPLFNPLSCDRPQHAATNLEHMALNAKALKYETWVAFSHAPWTETTLKMYTTDSAARAARMQNIMPTEWLSHITLEQPGLTRASEDVLSTVLDYKMGGASDNPFRVLLDEERSTYRVSYIDEDKQTKQLSYHFYEESIRPHTTFHPWCKTRRGQAARSMRAINSRSLSPDGKPVIPLIMALQDPVGITHELAHWGDMFILAQRTYMDELSVEFATWRNLNAVRTQVEQAQIAQQTQYEKTHREQDLQLLYQTMGAAGYSREQIKQFHDEGTLWANKQGIAYEWGRYSKKLNNEKLEQFTRSYDHLCSSIDSYMTPLISLRVKWLQDVHFIQCTEDHCTTEIDDNIHYSQIVGYAIASINLVSVGRNMIDEWIQEYSTGNKGNFFWRGLFFNHSDAMASMTSALADMKKESEKKEQPDEGDSQSIIQQLSAFLVKLGGQVNESADRANEAFEKTEQAIKRGAPLSLLQRIMNKGDKWLLSCADRALSRSTLGQKSGTALEGMFQVLFLTQASVPQNKILQWIKKKQWGKAAHKQFVKLSHNKIKIQIKESIKRADGYLNMHRTLISEEGALRVSNVKLLGVFFAVLELTSSKAEYDKAVAKVKNSGELTDDNELLRAGLALSSAGMWVVSWGANAVLPSLNAMAKSAGHMPDKFTLPSIFTAEKMSQQSIYLMSGKLLASGAGSAASILAVGVDFMDLDKALEKNGTYRCKAVGLISIKLASDIAYAIQTTDGLLALLGWGFLENLSAIALKREAAIAITTLIRLSVGAIGILASWPVMLAANIVIPMLVILFSDDELEKWCKQCVFGKESEIKNIESISVEKRYTIEESQQDKLIKALHDVFGQPLTEKLQKEQDQERLREYQRFTQIKN